MESFFDSNAVTKDKEYPTPRLIKLFTMEFSYSCLLIENTVDVTKFNVVEVYNGRRYGEAWAELGCEGIGTFTEDLEMKVVTPLAKVCVCDNY